MQAGRAHQIQRQPAQRAEQHRQQHQHRGFGLLRVGELGAKQAQSPIAPRHVQQPPRPALGVHRGTEQCQAGQHHRSPTEQHDADQQQRQPSGHLGRQPQGGAEHHTRHDECQRPAHGRHGVCGQKQAPSHPRSPCHGGQDGAQGAEKSGKKNALAAVTVEKELRPVDQFFSARTPGVIQQSAPVAPPHPERQGVTADAAGRRHDQGRPQGQHVQCHQCAHGEQHQSGGHEHADDEHRIDRGGQVQGQQRPSRVGLGPRQKALRQIGHRANANASAAAVSVCASSASPCRRLTKPASKADGARYTPRASMA